MNAKMDFEIRIGLTAGSITLHQSVNNSKKSNQSDLLMSQACVKNSVHGGRGVCLSACWDTHPLWADIPWAENHPGRHPRADTPGQTLPLGRHPLGKHPLGKHPLGKHPPGGHRSRWYTSYRNASLSKLQLN